MNWMNRKNQTVAASAPSAPLSVLRRWFLVSLLLIAFFVTAAPGGGGGGGSRSSGGSSSFRSGSNSSDHGGHGSSGSSSDFKAHPEDVKLFFGMAGLLILGLGMICMLYIRIESDCRLIEVVVVLPGKPYLPVLDELMLTADFTTSDTGQDLLKRLVREIAPEDILDGFVRGKGRFTSFSSPNALEVGEGLYHQRRLQLGLRNPSADKMKDVLPADPRHSETLYRQRLWEMGRRGISATKVKEERQADPQNLETLCVLGIVTTIGRGTPLKEGQADAAGSVLRWLGRSAPSVLYLYYGPDPGKRMPYEEPQQLVAALENGPESITPLRLSQQGVYK